ncbi:MAG: hypothetical protein ACM37W_19530 [Actinomycetota bacterium]
MPREKLASFNIDPQKWEQFKLVCEERQSSASVEILKFIDWILEGNALPELEPNSNELNARLKAIEARLTALETASEFSQKAKRKNNHRPSSTLSLPSFPVSHESVQPDVPSSTSNYY